MKRILPVALTALICCTLIISYLDLLNNRTGAELTNRTFTCFNRSTATEANRIFQFWQVNQLRLTSVIELIRLDYVLMIIYFPSIFFILFQLRKNNTRPLVKNVLLTGMVALVAGTAIDVIQDGKILGAATGALDALSRKMPYVFAGTHQPFADMRWYTFPKLILLAFSMFTALIVVVPAHKVSWANIKTYWIQFFLVLRLVLSQFLKCIWVFFPGILFLLLCIASFWIAGQGKDFMVAFTQNKARTVDMGGLHWSYSRIVFFLAIAFWAYVTWYSARVVYYIKLRKQAEPVDEIHAIVQKDVPAEGKTYPNIHGDFMIEFPRMTGNACFLVLELAFLQSPLMILAMQSSFAWILLIELLFAFYFVNRWVVAQWSDKPFFRTLFNWLGTALAATLVIISFLPKIYFASILALIIVLHVIYILYTNLHRRDMVLAPARHRDQQAKGMKKLTEMIMDFFCIPLKESGYYRWFIYTSVAAIVCYYISIHFLGFARIIGPFSFILLAFGVLLAFGNLVTAFSVKYKLNFHFLLFLLAFIVGLHETHTVRQKKLQSGGNTVKKMARPDLKTYLSAWLKKNDTGNHTAPIDMYFIMSNGGASRSGYWTASVLGRIEDASFHSSKKFSDQVFCLSGTSGGGVGVAGYFAALKNKDSVTQPNYERSLQTYLGKDYFTYTFARLLGPDYFHYIIPGLNARDRAAKLEESFEESVQDEDLHFYKIPFDTSFSGFTALTKDGNINYPLLFINTTRVQDGTPGVVSNLQIDSAVFNSRVDVIRLLSDTMDISLATGSILGARFPYLSPAGRIGNSDFVDGGYFDNSGAGVVQELVRAIVTIGKTARSTHDPLGDIIARIRFHVLHIVNSPIEYDPTSIQPIKPIQNDLLAPVLTILGAYDMQTTVNDGRLTNYLKDLKTYDSIYTDYARISLYQSNKEWAKDSDLHKIYTREPAYAMNWFMSDTTADRIIKRLHNNDSLAAVIKRFR